MHEISGFLDRHRNVIYFIIVFAFFVCGLVYAIHGYYHQHTGNISSNGQLLNVLMTPFIIAMLRLLIVVGIGIFLATVIVAIPLRKISVMQFEVEFREQATVVAEIQDRQLNQLLFLKRVLRDSPYFIGKYYQREGIPYGEIIGDILFSYEKFFNDELKVNFYFEIVDARKNEMFDNKKLNRFKNTLKKSEHDDYLIRNHAVMGNNLFMIHHIEQEEELFILLCSSKHIFTDYDVKIIQSLLETCRMICDSISVIPTD